MSSFSSLSTSLSSTSSAISPSSPANTPPPTHFNTIVFSSTTHYNSSSNLHKNKHALEFSIDPKTRANNVARDYHSSATQPSQLHNILAPVVNRLNTVQPTPSLNWKFKSQLQLVALTASSQDPLSPLAKLKNDLFCIPRFHADAAHSDHHLTEPQMLQYLDQYATSHHLAFPFLNLAVWSRKAKTAWRAIEYGSVLSFNQIELAVIFVLVALGARESCHESAGEIPRWANEYFNKTRAIIPNVYSVPMCLSVVQYMVLSSMYLAPIDPAEASQLASAALSGATRIGLHTLMDSSMYIDTPALNALESHRTYIAAYLWSNAISTATGHPVDQGDIGIALKQKAYLDIKYRHTDLLDLRIKLLAMARMHHAKPVTSSLYSPPVPTSEQTAAAMFEAFGDPGRYRIVTPPTASSNGAVSPLSSKPELNHEWLLVRIAYFTTAVLVYLPYMISYTLGSQDKTFSGYQADLDDWAKGQSLCLDNAVELVNLVLSQPLDGSDSGVMAWTSVSALELCGTVLLFAALTGTTIHNPVLTRVTTSLGTTNLTPTLAELESPNGRASCGLENEDLARILFSKRPVQHALLVGSGQHQQHQRPRSPGMMPLRGTASPGVIWMRALKMLN